MSDRIVTIGDVACGSPDLFLISGPCVVEDEAVMMRTAEELTRVSEALGVGVIYKSSFSKDNRSSLSYYHGPGLHEGLRALERVRDDFGFPILSAATCSG